MKISFIILIFFLTSSHLFSKENEPVVFTADNEYVYEVKLEDGNSVLSGLVAYQFARSWYFPLYELTSKLGLSFSYASDSKTVHGNIITESRPLLINLNNCTFTLNGIEEKYDCDSIKIYNDEIYINQTLYEKLIPLKLTVDNLQSLITITTQEIFPLMSKMKREQEGNVGIKPTSGAVDYGYPFIPKEQKKYDGFSQDVILGIQTTKNSAGTFQNANLQTNLTAELQGFETHLDLAANNHQITDKFLNFKKINEQGGLLGKANAKQIELYNFYFPSFPLIGGNSIVTGATVTNASYNTPTNFSSHHFTGELLSGWDVELYQNNLLIGRANGNSQGQYSFKDIPLLYGVNRFELIFYGPQGQVRHEYQTFHIGQNMTKDKKIIYRAASGKGANNQFLNAASFEKALNDSLSFNVAYTESELKDIQDKKKYILGGLNGFSNSFYYSLFAAKNIDFGTAYKATLAVPYRSLNFKIDRANLKNFKSREFDQAFSSSELENQTNFELFSPLFEGAVTRSQYSLDQYLEGETIKRFNNNFILNTSYFDFGNETQWDSSQPVWKFTPYLYKQLSSGSIRIESFFEKSFNFKNYKFEVRHNLSDYYDLSFSYAKDLITNISDYGSTLTRFFNQYSVSLQANAESKEKYSVACNFNFSYIREPRQKEYIFTRSALKDKGSVSVLAFIDQNKNNLRDANEPTLPQVGLRILQTNQNTETNEHGIAFFTDLPSYTPLDISIIAKSLPSLQHRSIEKGYQFISTPGSSNHIDVPIALFGDIEGSVLIEQKSGVSIKRGVLIQLRDEQGKTIRETRTDSEGFYLIEGVLPGNYEVHIYIEKDGINYQDKKSAIIDSNGEAQGNIDFYILKT